MTIMQLTHRAYWQIQYQRWRKYGTFRTIKRAFIKTLKLSIELILQPLALIAHVLGFRRINIGEQHIGHLASETDCFLKLLQLDLLPKKHYFMAISIDEVANLCLVDYWHPHITIITNPYLSFILTAASEYGFMKMKVIDFIATETTAARYYEVNSLWGDRPPLLKLNHAHRQRGREALRRLGLPEGAWFVCLHVREGGFNPENQNLHNYRDADINNCHLAIKTIAAMGGWVIRMGDPSMKKLDGLPNFINYAHSQEKSDWMDVFLCAECRLFLGTTSGLFLMSTAFGVPCALTNMTPLASQAFGSKDIYIPKLMRDKKTGHYLRFPDVFESPTANFRHSQLYHDAGIELEENTPEDINDLVQEAMLRLTNRWTSAPEDEIRLMNFKKLFSEEDYGYKSPSSLCATFLTKYDYLIL